MAKNKPKTAGSIKATAIVFFVLAVLSIVLFGIQFYAYTNTMKRCTESTIGMVTSVTTRVTTRRERTGGRRVRRYRVYYVYSARFRVGDETYIAKGESTASKYEENYTAVVYYDPDDPNLCYLEKCKPSAGFGFLGAAALLIFVGIIELSNLKKTKYGVNGRGQTFEEWQAQQRYEQANAAARANSPSDSEFIMPEASADQGEFIRYDGSDYYTGKPPESEDDFLGS